jgi:hypothetical protein
MDISPLLAWQNPQYAASLLAQAQFADWAATFQPIELEAMRQISTNNPAVLTEAVGTAKETATETSGAMAGIQERSQRALGIAPTDQQSATSKRLMNLNQALNVAGAENEARANVRTQDEQLLLGVGRQMGGQVA